MLLLPAAPTRFCSICGRMIQLPTFAIDDHGCAVHEDCYTRRAASKKANATVRATSTLQYLKGFAVRNA